MTRSADDKRARFLEAQQPPDGPAPLHGGSDCPLSATERAASGAAHRAAEFLRVVPISVQVPPSTAA